MAYDQEELKRLQKQYPNSGPILGPLLDKIKLGTRTQIQNPYENAGGGAAGAGAIVGNAGKTILNDYNRYFNTIIGNPIRAYGQQASDFYGRVGQAAGDFAKGLSSVDTSEPKPANLKSLAYIPNDQDKKDNAADKAYQAIYQRMMSGTNAPALPPMSGAARMEAQKGVPTTTESAAIREAARIEAERKGLLAKGYTPLNNQPGAIDARSGAPYLGPNDLLVKTRLSTPQEYTQAVNENQLAAQRGKLAGLPQDPNTQPYTPNDATLAGMRYGGPVTEYAIPGKGTATFLGQRQGGGSLSVVSGRTPEEQKAIDERVKSINSQTEALRTLRNANRQAQGLPTVEQEDQMNAMAAAMARMIPSAPDSSRLNEQEARYLQDLQNAAGLTEIGQGRLRDDRIKVAQTGLAQTDAQRKALEDRAARGQATGISMIQTMAAQDQARAKTAQDQAAALREQLNTDREFNLKSTQAEIDAYAKSRNIGLEQAKYELESFKAISQPKSNERFPNLTGHFYIDPLKPGQPKFFDYKGAASQYGIQPVPPGGKGMIVSEPYYSEDGRVIMADAQGNLVPFRGGWEGAAYQKWLEMQKR